MSKKKKSTESGFGKWLGRTIAVALIFSAGLITGQRLIRQDTLPPLVSLSVAGDAQAAHGPEAAEVKSPLKTTFSFYEHLTSAKDADVPSISAIPPKPSVKPVAKPKAKPETPKPEDKTKPEAKPDVAEAEQPEAPKPSEKQVEAVVEPVKPAAAEPVVPAQQASPGEKPAAEPLPARYSLQVGSHPSKAMAIRELSRLRAMGLEAHMVAVEVSGKRFYRVRVGKFHSMDEIRAFQADLKAKRGVDGFISPI